VHPPPTPLLADDVAAIDGEPDDVAEADTVADGEAPDEAVAAPLCGGPLARGDAEPCAEPDAAAVGVAECEETKAK
jgi:hypothetical protein